MPFLFSRGTLPICAQARKAGTLVGLGIAIVQQNIGNKFFILYSITKLEDCFDQIGKCGNYSPIFALPSLHDPA